MIRLAVSTQYRRVTDRQTDGQMDRHLATTQSALCIRIRFMSDVTHGPLPPNPDPRTTLTPDNLYREKLFTTVTLRVVLTISLVNGSRVKCVYYIKYTLYVTYIVSTKTKRMFGTISVSADQIL